MIDTKPRIGAQPQIHVPFVDLTEEIEGTYIYNRFGSELLYLGSTSNDYSIDTELIEQEMMDTAIEQSIHGTSASERLVM